MKIDNKLSVGHKIKSIRELKGFSQDYVATKVSLSQNAISKIENGDIKLEFDKVCEIAEVLEVDVNSLINFEPHNYFNNCQQFGVINTTFHTDKGLYEELIKAKDAIIKEKDMRISLLESQIAPSKK